MRNGTSLAELDRHRQTLTFALIATPLMVRAAQLWADARNRGRPTADPKELDCDVMLAAQALELNAVVATENVGHLSRYVTADRWSAVIL